MAERDIYQALAAYEDATHKPGGVDLPSFVAAQSGHAEEVVEYALFQHVFEQGAVYNADLASVESQARMLGIADAVLQRKYSRLPLVNLVDAAKQRGLTVPALAQRLRVTALEVSKLNQRLFRPDSVPSTLVRSLAERLGQSVEAVSTYLRMPPALSRAASYKADSAPRLAEQVDFREAVDTSRSMTPEDRVFWRDAE